MNTSNQSQSSDYVEIPGFDDPVLAESIIPLNDGSIEHSVIEAPGQRHWYEFTLAANKSAILTFTGPFSEYAISFFLRPLDKDEPAEPHTPMPEEPEDDVVEYTLNYDEPYQVYVSISGIDSTSVPSRGYTIQLRINTN